MRDCIASYGNCRNAIGDDAGFRRKWDNRRSWVGHFVAEWWNELVSLGNWAHSRGRWASRRYPQVMLAS